MDLAYITNYIAQLSRVPARFYQSGERRIEASVVPLKIDPFEHTAKELLLTSKHIDYVVTRFFELYGIVTGSGNAFVLGPVGYYPLDRLLVNEYAFAVGINDKNELAEHISALRTIPKLSLEFFLHMLCFLNYFVNNEKLTPVDLLITEQAQSKWEAAITANTSATTDTEDEPVPHTTYDFEQTMLSYISTGNKSALEYLFADSAPVGGKLSTDYIMQDKFIFISTLALVGRAGIRGGIEPSEALQLCDVYSLQCERLGTAAAIRNLQYRMIMDFTERVQSARFGGEETAFARAVVNYLQKNITKKIDGEAVAAHMHMSRTAMCKKFRAEAGVTIGACLSRLRIEEAKRLLRSTDKPLSDIANHLCYNSQSHFQNVFKKAVALTPAGYRAKGSSDIAYRIQ